MTALQGASSWSGVASMDSRLGFQDCLTKTMKPPFFCISIAEVSHIHVKAPRGWRRACQEICFKSGGARGRLMTAR